VIVYGRWAPGAARGRHGDPLRLAAYPAFGLVDFHALAGAHPDRVRLELGDHREHVEEASADGIGRVVHGTAKVERDRPFRELVGDRTDVGPRASESIELGDDERVAGATCRERPGGAQVTGGSMPYSRIIGTDHRTSLTGIRPA
jgi:hypothetical protein